MENSWPNDPLDDSFTSHSSNAAPTKNYVNVLTGFCLDSNAEGRAYALIAVTVTTTRIGIRTSMVLRTDYKKFRDVIRPSVSDRQEISMGK